MIGKVVLLLSECKKVKAEVKLCNVSDNIRGLIRITKLKIDIQKDREKAVAAFDKKGWFG